MSGRVWHKWKITFLFKPIKYFILLKKEYTTTYNKVNTTRIPTDTNVKHHNKVKVSEHLNKFGTDAVLMITAGPKPAHMQTTRDRLFSSQWIQQFHKL